MKKISILIISLYFIILSGLSAQSILVPDSLKKDLSTLSLDERYDFFKNLSLEWGVKEVGKSLLFAQLAHQEALKSKDEERILISSLRIGQAYVNLGIYDSLTIIANRVISSQYKTDDMLFEAKLLLARAQEREAMYSKSKANINAVISFYQSKGDSVGIYKASSLMASLNTSVGDYQSATLYHQRALTVSYALHDTAKMIIQYAKIASMYMRMDSFNEAYSYYLKGLKVSGNYKDTQSYKTLTSYLGSYYTRMHIYDSAEMYKKETFKLALKLGKKDNIAGEYLNLGNLYCRQGKFDIGKPMLDTALMLFKELDINVFVARVYDSYSVMHSAQGKQDSSLYYAKKVLKIARKTKNARLTKSSLYRMAAAYDKMQDYKNSLKYAKKYMFYNDSILSKESRDKVAELQAKFEAAKRERDIVELKAEQKAQKDKEAMLWISLGALLIIFLLIIMGVQQKRKKDKTIALKEKDILKKEKDLSDAELEKSKYQEEELKKEIQYKSRQLTTHALNMMQKNTLMQEIQIELVVISKKAIPENKTALNRVKMLIKKNLRSENDWELFKLYFEDVNKKFYNELATINTDLTSNDLKLCALLKLNMNIKESASVMNIEPASVKTARYKLRKKLNLKPDDDLVDFIRKIG